MKPDSLVDAAAAASSSIAALAGELTVIIPAYLRFAWLRARGQRDRGHLVLVVRQLAMSMSMLAAVWLTGVLLGLWRPLPTVLTVAPIVVTSGTLAVILVAVEMGRFLIRPPASFGRAALRVRSVRHPGRNMPPGPRA